MKTRKDNDLLKAVNRQLDQTEPKSSVKKVKKNGLCKRLNRRFRRWNKNHPLLTSIYHTPTILITISPQQKDIADRTMILASRINAGEVEKKMAATYAVTLFDHGTDQNKAICEGFHLAERLKHQGFGRFINHTANA